MDSLWTPKISHHLIDRAMKQSTHPFHKTFFPKMPKIFHDPHKNPPAPPPTYLMYGPLYKNNTSTITNNGYFSKQVQTQWGLRPGCPLSLLLYVIKREVTTTNIIQDEHVKGIKIPNYAKQIKLAQHADDSNFLLTDQNSAEKVTNFFQNLNKASGAIINLDKVKILPINTDQINYLQRQLPNIKTKERYETIKNTRNNLLWRPKTNYFYKLANNIAKNGKSHR